VTILLAPVGSANACYDNHGETGVVGRISRGSGRRLMARETSRGVGTAARMAANKRHEAVAGRTPANRRRQEAANRGCCTNPRQANTSRAEQAGGARPPQSHRRNNRDGLSPGT